VLGKVEGGYVRDESDYEVRGQHENPVFWLEWLTNSMVQNVLWAADNYSARQGIPSYEKP
jgi:hypothetical protein